ncbi:unnamed protein product [uncultured virus]|nr:unnamed protein product [uncultured virus]
MIREHVSKAIGIDLDEMMLQSMVIVMIQFDDRV